MKYFFLLLLIIFSVWIESIRFFSFQELFVSALVGGVSGVIWELCKPFCAKIEKNNIKLTTIIVSVSIIAVVLAYFNYEIGAKSALLALYSGFFVSEICADYGSKINEQAQKIMSRLKKIISSKVGSRSNKND